MSISSELSVSLWILVWTGRIQGDSKRWTQFRTSIFPELYMACEWSKYHLKEEVLNFQIPPLERSPSAQPCSSISWEQNGYYATTSQSSTLIHVVGRSFCLYTDSLFAQISFQRQMLFLVGGWMLKRRRNARCTAVAGSVLMNSQTQKILCCIVAILFSTDAAARLCTRQAL